MGLQNILNPIQCPDAARQAIDEITGSWLLFLPIYLLAGFVMNPWSWLFALLLACGIVLLKSSASRSAALLLTLAFSLDVLLCALRDHGPTNQPSLLMAALIIATGASAMFEKVHVFFTFWAIPALRDPHKKVPSKDVMSAMFGMMLPKGEPNLSLSQMHMMGMGTRMLKGLMRKKNVLSLKELMDRAAENGVTVSICEMSMDLLGIRAEDLIEYPGIQCCGVATFLQASTGGQTLFI